MAICRVCSADRELRKGRCPACNKYLRTHGYERPDDIIAKAAKRHEHKPRPIRILDDNLIAEEGAINVSPSIERGPCSCGRQQDRYSDDHDGKCKLCRDLEFVRSL